MIQLILDTLGYNFVLPESLNGGYIVENQELSVSVQMISGRMVKELRGNVWVISYQYGYFSNEDITKLIEVCEKGKKEPITCGFLQQGALEELTYSEFFVTSYTRPKFMWSRETIVESSGIPIPLWGDFKVELREADPHD